MVPLSPRERAEKRVGTYLRNKYRLDDIAGVGGMAAVYSATHRNGHRVAIKMLHLELSVDEEMRTRFVREGYVANGVGHDGVVKVIDDDIAEDGSVYVVMELLDGESVHERWGRAGLRLPLGEVVKIADEVLAVLVAAHARTIIHRDLKPDNLFITRDGRLKVLDFGIARWREAVDSATVSGIAMGTPAFMPPEQALGKRDLVDGRSDVFAVGATMFALLTGRNLHEGETFQELIVMAATRPAPPLRSLRPEIPVPIASVIDKALSMSRDERWPGALAMKRALADAWAACGDRPLGDIDLSRTIAAEAVDPDFDRTRDAQPRVAPAAPSEAAISSDGPTYELPRAPAADIETQAGAELTEELAAPVVPRVPSVRGTPEVPLRPDIRVAPVVSKAPPQPTTSLTTTTDSARSSSRARPSWLIGVSLAIIAAGAIAVWRPWEASGEGKEPAAKPAPRRDDDDTIVAPAPRASVAPSSTASAGSAGASASVEASAKAAVSAGPSSRPVAPSVRAPTSAPVRPRPSASPSAPRDIYAP